MQFAAQLNAEPQSLQPPGRFATILTRGANLASGQLQWIHGLVPGKDGRFRLRVSYVPTVRCLSLQRPLPRGRISSTAIKKTSGSAILREYDARALGALALGEYYFVDTRSPARVPLLCRRPAFELIHPITQVISESNTEILIAGKDALPDSVSALLHSRAFPVAPLAMFFIYEKKRTVVIPCSEILSACYVPSTKYFVEFIEKGGGNSYGDGAILFNGYRFVSASGGCRIYPVLAEANFKRAENEIRQLIPRAIAYARSGSGEMPIIIRPPLEGTVKMHGFGVQVRNSDSETILFMRILGFGPCRETSASRLLLPFAPHFNAGDPYLPSLPPAGSRMMRSGRSRQLARPL